MYNENYGHPNAPRRNRLKLIVTTIIAAGVFSMSQTLDRVVMSPQIVPYISLVQPFIADEEALRAMVAEMVGIETFESLTPMDRHNILTLAWRAEQGQELPAVCYSPGAD